MNCSSHQRSGALHITQKVDYGISILTAMGNKATSIKQIADAQGLPLPFLQKIAGKLQEAQLIKAERVKYGGYRLKKPVGKISMKEVIEALEGPIAIVPCLRKSEKECKHKPHCTIHPG